MAKKKHKSKYRPRNAAPSAPRPSRPSRAFTKPDEETPLKRLGYTAAAAAGTSLVGSMLVKNGWAPKTVTTALTESPTMSTSLSISASVVTSGGAMQMQSITTRV